MIVIRVRDRYVVTDQVAPIREAEFYTTIVFDSTWGFLVGIGRFYPELRSGADRRWRSAERRIQRVRASRPQLKRGSLGSTRRHHCSGATMKFAACILLSAVSLAAWQDEWRILPLTQLDAPADSLVAAGLTVVPESSGLEVIVGLTTPARPR